MNILASQQCIDNEYTGVQCVDNESYSLSGRICDGRREVIEAVRRLSDRIIVGAEAAECVYDAARWARCTGEKPNIAGTSPVPG